MLCLGLERTLSWYKNDVDWFILVLVVALSCYMVVWIGVEEFFNKGGIKGCNLIPKSTTLYGGSPGSSSEKTSTYSHTTRGRSKSGLSSSSRVRLTSQPANSP